MIKYCTDTDTDHIFFTADTHFCDDSIISSCKRPFSCVDEMNRTLIDNWNSVVGKDDLVFHIGDFCSSNDIDVWRNIRKQLNGDIILIMGESDENVAVVDHTMVRDRYRMFKDVSYQMKICINGDTIYMNHFPFADYDHSRNAWQLFGHVHSCHVNMTKYSTGMRYDAGVDNNLYKPISYNEIRNILNIRDLSAKC